MTGFSTARQYMVDGQVRPSDVTDDRILDAMLTVPREVFVPADKQALAYLDLDLDVAEGGATRRCLITPALLARMLQAAEIKSTDRVLVVGCATGYAAAVVARFAADVSATESDPALAEKATTAFAQLGIENITVKTAAAADGNAAGAPFDVIILNGATEIVPTGLFGQLKEGGRLVGVFGLLLPPRATLVTHSHGDFGHRELFDASAPVLPGFERVPAFVF
ncbi:protein-L-isoaspartate O-methyltransferase [Bradyrhizobium elkanii]|uniref:protein-L-isoaspartate O-methyltransferase family protein n=1 Tax=Bradyrhizobium elkanii TaxID=29448 RepID=UPI002712097F|nr:protein-L-isoaspartate O-methyltransferase [Bradyrhizobium elkanii]WLA36186.1 protein-L-isoaspartate O-methyltransferase [Bradyrhizobium elkanii]